MLGKLILKDGTTLQGESFGAEESVDGEVVFTTGMVGYPESLTDPSYKGQILVFTYPLIGNYGVPEKDYWESDGIKVSGAVVSTYNETPSHFQSKMTLSQWLKRENIPGLEIKDTRFLTKKLREEGTMLGKIIFSSASFRTSSLDFYDQNKENLVEKVSTIDVYKAFHPTGPVGLGASQSSKKRTKTIVLIDCGVKRSIVTNLLKRGLKVIVVPWDFDLLKSNLKCDAVLISNGPGDPKMVKPTISVVKKLLENKIPVLGVCLGNQILALAAGGDTYKLKFGHRSQNQPCIIEDGNRCYLTTQNHGFAVGEVPSGFKPWFTNANDQTNEGLIHTKYPFMSVQFHPEASPGPVDTEWIFDYFIEKAKL